MGRRSKTKPSRQKGEVVPLMQTYERRTRLDLGTTYENRAFSEDDSNDEELRERAESEPSWLDVVVDPDKPTNQRGLPAADAFLMIVQYVQVFAMIQSLSLRWTWPPQWLNWARYIFVLNADAWEFVKTYGDAYRYIQNYYTPSADVGFPYFYILATWGGLLFLFMLLYVACYIGFSRRKSPRMLVRLATLRKVLIFSVQLVAVPLGTALIRLFHCTDEGFVDTINELQCFEVNHWAYLAPALVVLVLVFVVFPIWLIIRTKDELLNMTPERHEGYLQLKEMEFVHGLDIAWIVGDFHVFASFRKPGAHFRACHLLCLGVLLILYGALFNYPFEQIVVINGCVFIMFLAFLILRPYRISAFNIMLVICYFCLCFNCLLGSFKTSYEFGTIQSPWLLPYYQFITIALVNGFWAACVIVFLIYITIKLTCCRRKYPLWPYTKFERLSSQTRKYVKGIIISRLLVEKVIGMPKMFTPIHEVARYIYVINAYCREAEMSADPLQTTLWDVLDELIEVHTNIAPRCLFAESTKPSIRRTAAEFMVLMPMFVRRLAQREYDMILMKPKKKRILLKLYALSVLLGLRRDRVDHSQMTAPRLHKIWHKPSEDDSDPGYYEDMYPAREPIVSGRTHQYDPGLLIRLEDEDEEERDAALIEDTEAWLRRHGAASGGGVARDPLAEWMGELGIGERPDTAITEVDFVIPELEIAETSAPRGARLRGGASLEAGSTSRAPSARSDRSLSGFLSPARVGSPGYRLGSRPGSRPGSAFSGQGSMMSHVLPGAIGDEDDDEAEPRVSSA